MAKVGYARVSSVGQSLETQLQKLESYGCDKIFQEKKSGLDGNRPVLKECLAYVREGDELVIAKIDRLARSTKHLFDITSGLESSGVTFTVLDQKIDTSTKEGKLLFGMLALIAEFETELRRERQSEGIARAKSNGIQFGRKLQLTPETIERIKQQRNDGAKISQIMSDFQLSKASIYRALSDQVS